MAKHNLLRKSRTTEVDTSIKKIIATYEKKDWSSDIHLVGLFAELKEFSEQLSSAILKQKEKSELDGLDGNRDGSITGFYYLVQGYLHHGDSFIREAAETIAELFENYTLSMRSESYAVESSLVDSLLEKLEDVVMQKCIAKLPGLSSFVSQLIENQMAFKSAHVALDESNAEDSLTLSATKIKKEILTHLNDSVQLYMSAMAHVDDSTYGELSRTVTQIITENNSAVKKRLANN